MKRQSKITKNKSNKKNTQDGEYNNSQDKRIYIDSDNAQVTIWYDILKKTRYIQINNLR